jgi:hypothetical protein
MQEHHHYRSSRLFASSLKKINPHTPQIAKREGERGYGEHNLPLGEVNLSEGMTNV